MSKVIKISLIIVILLFFTSNVYAIDMNINQSSSTNSLINDLNNLEDTIIDTENSIDDDDIDITSEPLAPTQRVTTTTVPESNLGLSNILNILLVVVGVVLILLAVAILIRLKG